MSRAGQLRYVGLLTCALVVASCTTEPAAPTTTVTTTTVATTTSSTTTTVPETTSTTSLDQRIAEVTEIVREVDFTFFNAIYQKDEQMLADALAVQDRYDNGLELMKDEDYFTQPPTREAISHRGSGDSHRPRGLSCCVVCWGCDRFSRSRRSRGVDCCLLAPSR